MRTCVAASQRAGGHVCLLVPELAASAPFRAQFAAPYMRTCHLLSVAACSFPEPPVHCARIAIAKLAHLCVLCSAPNSIVPRRSGGASCCPLQEGRALSWPEELLRVCSR